MTRHEESRGRRRPRPIRPPDLPAGPLKDLKAALYDLYCQAEQPTLDEIASNISDLTDELDLPGIPSRDTIRRIIGGQGLPPNGSDTAAVAAVLARMSGRAASVVVPQVRQLWTRAHTFPTPTKSSATPALDRIASSHTIMVGEAQARWLGVHDAIQIESYSRALPPYVPRDFDGELRTSLRAGMDRGCFILLVGGSSVGKSRTLYEIAREVMPDWRLARPTGVAGILDLAASPTPRTVVWLDELQGYLQSDGGLPEAIRALLQSSAVIVGTLWPHEYHGRSVRPLPGEPDPLAADREILDLADVYTVPDRFTPAENERAKAIAATDDRIRLALDTLDNGLTQVLAAGPELVRWWEVPSNPYGGALLTAALDARRVGASSPLSREFLMAATPFYLTEVEKGNAPSDWFDGAATYAMTTLRGAAAPLSKVSSTIGNHTGYKTADYLYQHARRIRREHPLPGGVWEAIVDHHNIADTLTLASSAERRMRHSAALALYREGVELGLEFATDWLARLLVDHNRTDEAIEVIRNRGSVSHYYFDLREIPNRLLQLGRVDEAIGMLRENAVSGDREAASSLAYVLAENGYAEEAIAVRRRQLDDGFADAADHLAELLAEHGQPDEAIAVLREHPDTGFIYNIHRLGQLLAEHGHVDEAIEILREHVDSGSTYRTEQLVALLSDRGRADQCIELLRERAHSGHPSAARQIAGPLASQGRIEEAVSLLQLSSDSVDWLAGLLAELGQPEQAAAIRHSPPDMNNFMSLDDPFTGLGHAEKAIAILRENAEAGDGYASRRLSELLSPAERHAERAAAALGSKASNGDQVAVRRYEALLTEVGLFSDVDGNSSSSGMFSGDLPGRASHDGATSPTHDEPALLRRTYTGDQFAASQLVDFLNAHGRRDECVLLLKRLADAGEHFAADWLIELFVRNGQTLELLGEVDAGTSGAAERVLGFKVWSGPRFVKVT